MEFGFMPTAVMRRVARTELAILCRFSVVRPGRIADLAR